MHSPHRGEHVVLVNAQPTPPLKLVGEHVEQDLRVRIRVHVPEVIAVDLKLQGIRIDEVAVVGKRDSVRRVDVEGLRFGGGVPARGGIAHVTDPHGALEREHVAGMEHVPNESAALALMQALTVPGDNAGRVLPAVLQRGEGVVEVLVDRRAGDDAYDGAHTRADRTWMPNLPPLLIRKHPIVTAPFLARGRGGTPPPRSIR